MESCLAIIQCAGYIITTAAQNGVLFSYHTVRGLHFLVVAFAGNRIEARQRIEARHVEV